MNKLKRFITARHSGSVTLETMVILPMVLVLLTVATLAVLIPADGARLFSLYTADACRNQWENPFYSPEEDKGALGITIETHDGPFLQETNAAVLGNSAVTSILGARLISRHNSPSYSSCAQAMFRAKLENIFSEEK